MKEKRVCVTGKGTCWIYNQYIYIQKWKKSQRILNGCIKKCWLKSKTTMSAGCEAHTLSHAQSDLVRMFQVKCAWRWGISGIYYNILFWGGMWAYGREYYGFSGQLLPQILLRIVAFMASWQAGRQLQLGLTRLKPFSVASPTFANWSQFHGSTCNGIHSVVSCSQSPVRL